jgi:glutamate racemase
LACTHYPLIRPEIEEYYAGSVQVFDSIDATAAAIQQSLKDSQIASSSKSQNDEFYVSDLTESFQHTTGIFFGKDVHLEKLDIWTKQN